MIRLATFNLFWFPETKEPAFNERGPDAHEQIARVVTRLDADAIVFEEMLDRDRLHQTLELTGRPYEVVDTPDASGEFQRVMIAFDSSKLELVETTTVFARPRPWLALRLRTLDPAPRELWLVGGHLKSANPLPGTEHDSDDQGKRRHACESLAEWIDANHAAAPPIFVLGDFNMVPEHESFEPFATLDPPLSRVPHRVLDSLPEHGGEIVGEDERWSTLTDRVVIDHAFVSESAHAWLKSDAVVYAFDLDPFYDEAGASFFRVFPVPPLELIPSGKSQEEEVIRMYNVSDHRPLRIEIEPA